MKTVLLVEDNDDDVYLMRLACQRTGIPHHFVTVPDGDAAVAYLSDVFSMDATQPPPNVVFLDIKMPKRDGHQVLHWIRARPELKNLPVIMLTGSNQTADVNKAYAMGATSYLQKMPDLAEFTLAVRIVLKYWLDLHVIPSSSSLTDDIKDETTSPNGNSVGLHHASDARST